MQVEKISYRIDWKQFKRGYSFFIPCLDPKQAKREVLRTTNRLGMEVLMRVVIEEGIRGLRIWRL